MRAVRDSRYKLIRNLASENTYHIRGIHDVQTLRSWQADAEENPELAKRIDRLFRRPAVELYDLESDPLEQTNLAEQVSMAAVKARLGKQLDAWMASQGDQGLPTELKAKSRQGRAKRKPKE